MSAKKYKFAVIGLGYVGLPLSMAFAKAGHRVLGVDIDSSKVSKLNQGLSPITDISSEDLASQIKLGNFEVSSDFSKLKDVDAISICVPTPLRKTKEPDISYILSATQEIAKVIQKGQLVILESTTYPGTTREVVLPELEKSGLKVGKDFYLAFSPERIDPGNRKYTLQNTPKIIGGITSNCTEMALALYGSVLDRVYPVSSSEVAEMVKLLENTFRAVNIGMVNEMAMMADRLNLDVWEIIDAASTKPFGYMPFYPGPGLGGHCIPIDPHYLSWKLKTLNFHPRFIELAQDINSRMPGLVVDKIAYALNRFKKPVSGSKVLLLGVSYKKDVGDVRESPALDIIKLLQDREAQVFYEDRYSPHLTHEGLSLASINWDEAHLGDYDCVVIVTNHAYYDIERIVSESKILVDCRNATKGLSFDKNKVIKI